METENPENLEGAARMFAGAFPDGLLAELDVVEETMDLVPNRIVAELDACYASDAFMDDLDWALQTYDICRRESGEEENMDDELEMLEASGFNTFCCENFTPAAAAPAKPSIPIEKPVA
jgi:hypothetical protein